LNHICTTSAKLVDIYAAQTYMVPENGQELRPTNVGAIINKNIVHQVSIKYYISI